jgi:hypothetical protein
VQNGPVIDRGVAFDDHVDQRLLEELFGVVIGRLRLRPGA